MGEVEIPKNCHTCAHLGSDSHGGDYDTISWFVCENNDPRGCLRSFPFKKEQKCHVPCFWAYMEYDKEISDMFDRHVNSGDFSEAYKRFEEKYINHRFT